MATCGAAGGNTDGHARAIVQSGIQDRGAGRIEAEGPGDLNGGPIERGPIEGGRGMGPDCAPAFHPHVAGPVNHDFADILIFENRFQARQRTAAGSPCRVRPDLPRSYLARLDGTPIGHRLRKVVRLEINADGACGVGAVIGQANRLAIGKQGKLSGLKQGLPLFPK